MPGFLQLDLLLNFWIMASFLLLAFWILHYVSKNATLADVGFCLAFGLVSLGYAIHLQGDDTRRVILSIMGMAYGLRLGVYLLWDRVWSKPEDKRYQTLRKRLGRNASWVCFLYFQAQAVAVMVFSLPLWALMENPDAFGTIWDYAGIVIWIVAITGESVADWQLARFRRNPNNLGKTLREGLWRYSRHPNYFFEGVLWCAYVVMGIGAPHGWITLIGPVLMISALLKISGVPLAEAQALSSRRDDYRSYQQRTNLIIPWFPKESYRSSWEKE